MDTHEILGGIRWRATLGYSAGYSAGSTGGLLWWDTRRDWRDTRRDTRRDPQAGCVGGILGGIPWPAALAGYSAGSTGELLWWDTRRDPLASRSGGMLGGIHWRDIWRDPLSSSSGGILGGIHWRAALAGYWAGAWCRSIANADSNIKSNNPFLSGGEKPFLRTQIDLEPCAACFSRIDSGTHIPRTQFACFPPQKKTKLQLRGCSTPLRRNDYHLAGLFPPEVWHVAPRSFAEAQDFEATPVRGPRAQRGLRRCFGPSQGVTPDIFGGVVTKYFGVLTQRPWRS